MSKTFTPIIVDYPQLSRQWFEARLGNVTGSMVKCTMSYYAVTKTHIKQADEYFLFKGAVFIDGLPADETLLKLREEYSFEYCLRADIELAEKADRKSYRQKVVTERINETPADDDIFVSKAMRWGQEQERYAKARYHAVHGHIVKDAPLMLHPELMCGASPDGFAIDIFTGEIGNIEVKCLEQWNHLYKIIWTSIAPLDYFEQIQMQLWITGNNWCDFIGYDPRAREGLQLFVERINRDDFYINEVLVPSIKRFLEECDFEERRFYAILKQRTKQAEERNKILMEKTI